MEGLRRQVDGLLNEVALLRRQPAERDARIAEREVDLKRRGKRYCPKANTKKSAKKRPDRRKRPHREHPGVFREPPVPDEKTIHHDVRLDVPGTHIGPRTRLLAGYSRAYLGISLEKRDDLLWQLFGLNLSRAETLGHIRWGAVDPSVSGCD